MNAITPPLLTADLRVSELLGHYPHLTQVFARAGMQCPGCPFMSFHSLKDACREHHRDLTVFLSALQIALQRG